MEKYFDTRLNLKERKSASRVWFRIAQDLQRLLKLDKFGKVLDLGAGYGDFSNQVLAHEKWAVDKWSGTKRFLNQDIHFLQADITQAQSDLIKNFDLVFMSNVLEHFPLEDVEKILTHVKEYLKSGGYLALLQPNFKYCIKSYFNDYTHKTIFTDEGLTDLLLDHGFEITHSFRKYLPFSFKSRLPHPDWVVWLYLRFPWKPMAAQMLIIARWNNGREET